jgi:uncharacterized membrane protein YsdA (DUF1294 family)
MIIFVCILAYLAAINLIAYRAFAHDKKCAEANRGTLRDRGGTGQLLQRTPEGKLLFYAIIGGWAGAKYAQQKLRHKSYKQPFGKQLNDIAMIQGIMLCSITAIFAFLLLAAPDATARAQIAVQERLRVDAPPLISLRPPAARPAT